MLNIDLKIISKTLSEKLKKVLPDLIYSKQTVYGQNRHVAEGGILISDVIEIPRITTLEDFFNYKQILKKHFIHLIIIF